MLKPSWFKSDSASLNDAISLWRIEDDLILQKDGRVAIGFEFNGAAFESLTPADYNSFFKIVDGAFNALPENYIVQKIDCYSNAYYPYGRSPEAFSNKEFFEKESIRHVAHRPVLEQKSYLFVITDTVNNHKRNSLNSTFSKARFGSFNESVFLRIEERKESARYYGRAFADTLQLFAKIALKPLQAKAIKELYYQILNLEFNGNCFPPYKTILNEKNALVVGEKKVNIISMQEFCEEVYCCISNDFQVPAPMLYRLGIYLQFPHITMTAFSRENTQKLLNRFDRTRSITEATVKLSRQSGEIKATEIKEFTEHVRKNDLKFMAASVNVLLYNSSDQQREQQIQAVRDAMRSTYNMQPLLETFDTANSFFSFLPGAGAENLRWLIATTDVATCLMNPTHEFRSRSQGDYISDRFRNLVYIDLFDRDLNNQNAIVVGPSGSGKSFTMGHFILQRFERKDRQIIIDVGGTYKNILDALGASDNRSEVRYFEYSPENPLSFNPFLVPTDDQGNYVFTDDKAQVLLTLFGLVIKEANAHSIAGLALGKSEWPIYEQLFTAYYQHLNSVPLTDRAIPSVSHFFQWADQFIATQKGDLQKNLERIRFSDTVICFQPFTEGRYKTLLNSTETTDLSDFRLICFDMARVKDLQTLYPIVAFLLIELSMDIIRRHPNDRKYFVMDEAWSMLSDSMGTFVEYLYRTIRKNNGSMTIVTQGVEELNTDIGAIIKSKCETKIVLNHSTEAEIQKVGLGLGLTRDEMKKISSIRVNKQFRELFIKQGVNSTIFLLEVPPAEHAVLTSNPVERNHLIALKKEYGNLEGAIKQWEEDKLNGFFKDK